MAANARLSGAWGSVRCLGLSTHVNVLWDYEGEEVLRCERLRLACTQSAGMM